MTIKYPGAFRAGSADFYDMGNGGLAMDLSDAAIVTVLIATGLSWAEIWQRFKAKFPTEDSLRRHYSVAVECYYFWSN